MTDPTPPPPAPPPPAPPPSAPPQTPDAFWRLSDPAALQPPPPATVKPVPERLGPSPFPASRFPFLGFLATLYDHIAAPWRK